MDLDRNSLDIGDKPALIVVDIVNGFTDPACPLGSDNSDVVAANISLLEAFRAKGLPVFFTTTIYDNDEQAQVFRKRVPALNLLTPDSSWVEIDPELARREDEPIVVKQWASGFHKTDLDAQLRSLGVDSLVITGLTTSGCVRATVVDGLQNDYVVVVPREAVGDRNKDAHAANLHDMHAKYADVLGIEDVLCHIYSLPACG